MPEVIGIIPARYASRRLPGKPLAMIANRPMIQRVYERAAAAASLQRLVVATDDIRIRQAVEAFGGEVLLTSPNHKSGTDRVAEAARQLRLPGGAIVLNIQGDEPLLEAAVLDSLSAALEEATEVPMATLAHRGKGSSDYHDPSVVKVVFDSRSRALYFSRRPIPAVPEETDTPPYYIHLGLYAYRNAFLQRFANLPPSNLEREERLEQLRALEHGFPILVVVTPFGSLSLDTAEDLARVREIFAQQG